MNTELKQVFKTVEISQLDREEQTRISNANKKALALKDFLSNGNITKKLKGVKDSVTFQLKDEKGEKLKAISKTIKDDTAKFYFNDGLYKRANNRLNETLNEKIDA